MSERIRIRKDHANHEWVATCYGAYVGASPSHAALIESVTTPQVLQRLRSYSAIGPIVRMLSAAQATRSTDFTLAGPAKS